MMIREMEEATARKTSREKKATASKANRVEEEESLLGLSEGIS